jgi:addiction module HigA family antidote
MIGTSQVVISDVMMGRRSITPLIALRFEEATGVRAEFWCRLQANYDITTLRLSKASDSEVIPEQPDSEGADKP